MIDGWIDKDGKEYRMTSEEIEEWHKNNDQQEFTKPTDEEIEKQENLSNEQIEERLKQEEIEEEENKKNSQNHTWTEKDFDIKDPWEIRYIEIDGKKHKVGLRYRPKYYMGLNILAEPFSRPKWLIPAFGARGTYFDLNQIEDGYIDDLCNKYNVSSVLVLGRDQEYSSRIAYQIDKYRTNDYKVRNYTGG